MNKVAIIWILLRFFIGSIFCFAGFHKITGPVEDFHAAILAYDVVPYNLALFAAWTLPWIEVICGLGLILGVATRWVALGCSLMAVSFLTLMGLSYLKLGMLPEECGCFGHGFKIPVFALIALDVFLVFTGILLACQKKHFFSLENKFFQS